MGNVFKQEIEESKILNYKTGLTAIKKSEGGGQIIAENNSNIRGSVDIDSDTKTMCPQANRWDYAIGYGQDEENPHIYYIEVHSAHTHSVSEIERKLKWLTEFLNQEYNQNIKEFPCSFHWVMSGKFDIPKNTPQYRKLAKLKTGKPTKILVMH